MRVCLGGTFEPFHVGHEALLRAAVDGATEVFIGITGPALSRRADRTVSPWRDRARRVEEFVRSCGFAGRLVVRELEDPMGPAASGDYDRVVVSAATRRGADAINAARARAGHRPLEVRVVPLVVGEDLLPVSATSVAAGLIDRDGRRLAPVRVAVGSANDVKVAAVRTAIAGILRVACEVRALPVASGVPEQPKGKETMDGARRRAQAARAAWPECDYAVGIEAGIIDLPGDAPSEAQACVVVDRAGRETVGWGPAFHYPAWVTRRALAGEMVSAILGPVARDPRLGSTTGAIGWLTDGRMDRAQLCRIALLMAFVPRLRADAYAMP